MKPLDGIVEKRGDIYVTIRTVSYWSKRYDKYVTIRRNWSFDGATFAKDINSMSWLVHDVLCYLGHFDDGTECTNLQASLILYDILKSEGRWFRKYTWFLATWLFGGGSKLRSNGLI